LLAHPRGVGRRADAPAGPRDDTHAHGCHPRNAGVHGARAAARGRRRRSVRRLQLLRLALRGPILRATLRRGERAGARALDRGGCRTPRADDDACSELGPRRASRRIARVVGRAVSIDARPVGCAPRRARAGTRAKPPTGGRGDRACGRGSGRAFGLPTPRARPIVLFVVLLVCPRDPRCRGIVAAPPAPGTRARPRPRVVWDQGRPPPPPPPTPSPTTSPAPARSQRSKPAAPSASAAAPSSAPQPPAKPSAGNNGAWILE